MSFNGKTACFELANDGSIPSTPAKVSQLWTAIKKKFSKVQGTKKNTTVAHAFIAYQGVGVLIRSRIAKDSVIGGKNITEEKMNYTGQTVFEAALDRIREVFDNCDDIIVAMSGGKDSTVLFHLAMIVAKEKNRLPLKVFWLDQEAEWQHTVDYMDKIMHRPDVKPYWYQIPFDFTNSLPPEKNFVHLWDPSVKDKWIHPQSDISIKVNPSPLNRFHKLINGLYKYMDTENDKACGVLVGMRASESVSRRNAITGNKAQWRGETWASKEFPGTHIRKFWPIYDFKDDDIWAAIGKNHWEYNKVYDLMYRWGVSKHRMRVSALIHETAWQSIQMLQEFEPKTYNRFVARIPGVSTFNHSFDYSDEQIIPRELPIAFKDWKEYRDYLLVHIVKPEYWDIFRNRWKNQNTEDWYKVHVHEIVINDIDGTVNHNHVNALGCEEKAKLRAKEDERLIEKRKQ